MGEEKKMQSEITRLMTERADEQRKFSETIAAKEEERRKAAEQVRSLCMSVVLKFFFFSVCRLHVYPKRRAQ